MGADAVDYRMNQKEDLRPMRNSIRIYKRPNTKEDPWFRLWKFKHIRAVRMLQGPQFMQEPPIDPAMIAKIQGVVFKTLRPRSIQMHMEARRLYRIKKARKEVAELPEEKTMIEKDLGLRHQQWLEALEKLEAKPLEEAPEPERVDPLVRCHC